MSYEWMVKYTPQEEWIEGQGVLLWLAFFFSEIGAGIYLVSLFLNFRPGWLTGWLVTLILGGLIHVAYLGNPMRAWRILLKPVNSELSRGLWIIFIFAAIGFFQILPVVFSGLPWTGNSPVLKAIMGILCILIIGHGFLTMNVVKALPMWNSPMMLPLSLVSGIFVGSQAVEFMSFLAGRDILVAELWARWSLIGYMGILLMFLWGTAQTSETARASIKGLVMGDSSVRFYIGVIIIGILIPLIITLTVWGGDVSKVSGGILFLRFVCVLIGDLMMRYTIMKGALYSPLI